MLHNHTGVYCGDLGSMKILLPGTSGNRGSHHGLGVMFLLLALLLAVATVQASTNASRALPPIVAQIDAGHFRAADAAITGTLAQPGTIDSTRQDLLFQRERMRRILLDFTLSADDVKTRVRQSIPDLTDAEFTKWNAAGLFEHRVIDAKTLFFKRSPCNLFRLSPEALARRAVQTPLTDGPMEVLNGHQRAIYHAALSEHRTSVLPRRIRMTQILTVDADAVPAGETVRAWIPYPQAVSGQQQDIRFVSSEPSQHRIAPASALQRTVYLQKPAQAGSKTTFSITYEVTWSPMHWTARSNSNPQRRRHRVPPRSSPPALMHRLAGPGAIATPGLAKSPCVRAMAMCILPR